jgi:hypothetical protein
MARERTPIGSANDDDRGHRKLQKFKVLYLLTLPTTIENQSSLQDAAPDTSFLSKQTASHASSFITSGIFGASNTPVFTTSHAPLFTTTGASMAHRSAYRASTSAVSKHSDASKHGAPVSSTSAASGASKHVSAIICGAIAFVDAPRLVDGVWRLWAASDSSNLASICRSSERLWLWHGHGHRRTLDWR